METTKIRLRESMQKQLGHQIDICWRADASYGLLLAGNGHGSFEAKNEIRADLISNGDIRDILANVNLPNFIVEQLERIFRIY